MGGHEVSEPQLYKREEMAGMIHPSVQYTWYICNGDRVTVSSVVSNSDRLVAYRGDRSVNEGRHDA